MQLNINSIHYFMKNSFKFLCLTLICMLSFSCQSEDDGNNDLTEENEAKIIGTWRFQSSTTDGVTDTDNDPCLNMLTIMFTSTQVTTNDVYGNNCDMSETYINAYSINGNTITITDEGETYDSEIRTLNATTFTIEDTDDGIIYTETYLKQ